MFTITINDIPLFLQDSDLYKVLTESSESRPSESKPSESEGIFNIKYFKTELLITNDNYKTEAIDAFKIFDCWGVNNIIWINHVSVRIDLMLCFINANYDILETSASVRSYLIYVKNCMIKYDKSGTSAPYYKFNKYEEQEWRVIISIYVKFFNRIDDYYILKKMYELKEYPKMLNDVIEYRYLLDLYDYDHLRIYTLHYCVNNNILFIEQNEMNNKLREMIYNIIDKLDLRMNLITNECKMRNLPYGVMQFNCPERDPIKIKRNDRILKDGLDAFRKFILNIANISSEIPFKKLDNEIGYIDILEKFISKVNVNEYIDFLTYDYIEYLVYEMRIKSFLNVSKILIVLSNHPSCGCEFKEKLEEHWKDVEPLENPENTYIDEDEYTPLLKHFYLNYQRSLIE